MIFAAAQRTVIGRYHLAHSATVAEALALAAADSRFAAVDFRTAVVGVFGRVIPPAHLLCDGDRIEIYRPLAADPKMARRARAREARKREARNKL